jgi:hypothetical protein
MGQGQLEVDVNEDYNNDDVTGYNDLPVLDVNY